MFANPGLSARISDLLRDYPDVDKHSCRLLGPTGLVVQALMGVLSILSLVYKRHRERPKRPWRIWLFDVSKQVVGQMFVHGVNLLISDVGAHHKSSNACVFYFLNILLDTTVGVAIIYVIHHGLTYILTEKLLLKGFKSGMYGSPPSASYWARQAAVYVASLTTMKLLVVAIFAFVPIIFKLGEWLLSWTHKGQSDAFQVAFTMGLFPIMMNILQFWLVDSIVKASSASIELLSDSPNDHDREPLFVAQSDEEDDDDDGSNLRKHDIEDPLTPSSLPGNEHLPNGTVSARDEIHPAETVIPGNSYGHLGGATEAHAYPPSVSSSTPSTSYSSASSRKQKRSPPPAIPIRQSSWPAVNSPQASAGNPSVRVSRPVVEKDHLIDDSSQEWASSWVDSDDWANKVGEEEWTGRSVQSKVVLESWSPIVQVGS